METINQKNSLFFFELYCFRDSVLYINAEMQDYIDNTPAISAIIKEYKRFCVELYNSFMNGEEDVSKWADKLDKFLIDHHIIPIWVSGEYGEFVFNSFLRVDCE